MSAIAAAEALLTPQMLGTITSVLLEVVEDVSQSATVDKIIAEIQAFLPALIKIAPDLAADVISVITNLTSKAGITDDQMAALTAAKTALDTQTDADIAAALAYAAS